MRKKLLLGVLVITLMMGVANVQVVSASEIEEPGDNLSPEQERMYQAVIETVSELGGDEWRIEYDDVPIRPFGCGAHLPYISMGEEGDRWANIYCEQQENPQETLDKVTAQLETGGSDSHHVEGLLRTSLCNNPAVRWDEIEVTVFGEEIERTRVASYIAFVYDGWYCYVGGNNYSLDVESIAQILCQNLGAVATRNSPPLASFDIYPPNPTPDDSVVFVSTSSDADGDVLSNQWYLDGEKKGSFPSYEAGKLKPGNYAVTLLVDDGKGGKDDASRMITIGLPASLEISASPGEVTLKNEEKTPFTITVTIKDNTGKMVDGAYVHLICEDPDLLTSRWWGKWVEKKYTENGVAKFSGTFPDLLDVSTMVKFPTYVKFTVKAGKIGESWEPTGEKTINVLAEPRLFEIVLFDYYPEPKMKRAVFSDSDYHLRVKIRDEGDSIYWDYFITTPIGNLSGVDATVNPDGKKIMVSSPFDEEQVEWHTPERGINLEDLEFAKKLYQIDLAYARNLAATAAGTIPVYGRFIKGANDTYNVYDGVKTTWGYSKQAWRNLQRFEIIGAIMDVGNVGIEVVQTTAGAVLIIPKAIAPAGAKEAVNLLTDTLNAGIDHIQAGVQQFSEWSAPPEEYMALTRLQAKVRNQQNIIAKKDMLLQFVWWD